MINQRKLKREGDEFDVFLQHRLHQLGLEQRNLAGAAQVTESYISRLFDQEKRPPLLFSRYLTTLLFAVQPTDPATFAAVALLLCATGLTACYVPARPATRIDPMVALRHE